MKNQPSSETETRAAVGCTFLVRQPDCLYLQWNGDAEPGDSQVSEMDVTWCRNKCWPYDIEYARVPNDAFIAPLMRWLVQREGKCAATTMIILKRKLDRYIESANHDEWRKLPNDQADR